MKALMSVLKGTTGVPPFAPPILRVGELVIAQAMLLEHPAILRLADEGVMRRLSQVKRITSDLQRNAMSMRMVPVRQTFQKMARLVRDLSKKSGKPVDLILSGEDTELDRKVVEEIKGLGGDDRCQRGPGRNIDWSNCSKSQLLLADDDGRIALLTPGEDLRFEADEGAALEKALSGEAFAVSELACDQPVDLVRKLFAAGVVERA